MIQKRYRGPWAWNSERILDTQHLWQVIQGAGSSWRQIRVDFDTLLQLKVQSDAKSYVRFRRLLKIFDK